MGPAAAVGTDHVGTVADRSEDKAIGLRLDYLFVAESYCQPVVVGLFYFKGERWTFSSYSGLHNGELIC